MIRRGVAWNAIGLGLSKGSSILAKLVLARLLLPEHFGFVSMMVVFTSITRIIADLGFRQGLIQRQRDHFTKTLYDSAFWLLLAMAFVMIAVMWLIGVPFLVWFYAEPRLGPVAVAMSVIVVFQNLQVVPEARLTRIMRFKHIVQADVTGTLIGCVAAIGLALAGAGVWSLVAQTLLAAACTSAVMFARSGWRPCFRVNLRILADLSCYSRFIVGSRVLISLQHNLDYLLIGKLLGAYALGIYAIAYLLTETLRAQAYWLVGKTVFPFFSMANGRDREIRSVYLGTVRYLSMAVFPVAMLLILFASDIVPTLFTPKWNAAITPVQILGSATMVVASGGTPSDVLRGIGRPDLDFRINFAVAFLVALPALWFGIAWAGLPGAALAVLVYSCVSRIAYGVALNRLMAVSMHDVFRALQQPLLGCGLMAIIGLLVGPSHWLVALTLALAAYAAAVLNLIIPFFHGKGRRGRSRHEHPPGRDATVPSSLPL